MKIIFLDFDGVLNSQASFRLEFRKKQKTGKPAIINQTLSEVACSNLQTILDAVPEAKIVISSAWRTFFDLPFLKAKLDEYGIDSSRVIGVTGKTLSGHRGREIKEYLEDIYEARAGDPYAQTTEVKFVVIDDNVHDLKRFEPDNLVETSWEDGLLLSGVKRAIEILGGDIMTEKEMCKKDDELDDEAKSRLQRPTDEDINLSN